jgi:hypothetical protein
MLPRSIALLRIRQFKQNIGMARRPHRTPTGKIPALQV